MQINNALWNLIVQSDTLSQGVIVVLLFMSIICWTVAVYKALSLRAKVSQIKKAQKLLENIPNIQDFISKTSTLSNNFSGEIIAHYLTDFKLVLNSNLTIANNITDKDWQMLQSSMSQTLDSALTKEESLMSILSTCAQSAPLMGLFGTVWGLIHSFLSISHYQTADISVVAPGIAEALLTTLAGLVVAIPALILFNYLQSRINLLEQRLIALTDQCYWIMKKVTTKVVNSNENTENISTSYMPPQSYEKDFEI